VVSLKPTLSKYAPRKEGLIAHDQFKRALKSMGINLTDVQFKTLHEGNQNDDAENMVDDEPTRLGHQLVIEDFVKDVKNITK